jgi:hypothetical protein
LQCEVQIYLTFFLNKERGEAGWSGGRQLYYGGARDKLLYSPPLMGAQQGEILSGILPAGIMKAVSAITYP